MKGFISQIPTLPYFNHAGVRRGRGAVSRRCGAFIDIPGLGIIIEGMVGRSGTFGKGLGPFMLLRP